MVRCLVTLGVAGLVSAVPLSAQSTPADSLLEHLVGTWVLEGSIGSRQTTHDITAVWVLGHEYVQLHEVSRERAATGAPAYEAIIYFVWDPQAQQYACLWMDNTGTAPFEPRGLGRPTGDSIPFVFGVAGTESIRNTFVYDRRTDTWQWRIDNEEAGVLRAFARVTLRRR